MPYGITIYGCGPDEAVLFRKLAPRVGVVPTITAAAVCDANVALAAGNRWVSVGHKARVANSTLRALSRAGVTYVSTRSAGYDHIDVDYAARVGITVRNVAYSPDSVADFTLMLMLMVLRNAKDVLRRVEAHDYRLPETGAKRELRDLTVGVVGTGRIGAAVIERIRGFGSRIMTGPLDELLTESDVVTLHAPLTKDTHHLLDRRRIENMRPGAFVVNTGRGGLVDTEALATALESGRLGGAALDVLEGEEGIFYQDCRGRLIKNELLLRLRRLPNVVITPHTAYYTDHALSDIVENQLLEVRRELQHA
jgi:D-specific alpha-keto acid dehydrogenase